MPNHVTHNCIVRGSEEEISRFIKTMFQEDEHGKLFDFNQVVPMPELLRGSDASSAVSDGLAVLGYESGFGVRVPKFVGKEKALERYMNWPWVKEAGITTAEQLAEKLIERNPDIIEKAQRAIKALEECGHIGWYGWSVQNWGTKRLIMFYKFKPETKVSGKVKTTCDMCLKYDADMEYWLSEPAGVWIAEIDGKYFSSNGQNYYSIIGEIS